MKNTIETARRNFMTIEYFRAVLCICIMMFHAGIHGTAMFWGGVQVFFALSAFFLVLKSISTEERSEVNYTIRKRINRLYLPYLTVIIIAVIYAILKSFKYRDIVVDILLHLFCLQNLEWIHTDYYSVLQPMTAHTWTMGIEVWIYILFVVIIKYCEREKIKRVFIGIIVGTIIYRWCLITLEIDKNWVSLFPLAQMDSYAMGGLAAICYKKTNQDNLSKPRFLRMGGGAPMFRDRSYFL